MRAVSPSLIALAAIAVGFSAAACSNDPTPAPASGGTGAGAAGSGKPTPPDLGPPDEEAPPTPAVDCSGNPGELYALTANKLDVLDPVKLCAYRGSVLLIVNGASGCGYTPQYAPLQKLYAKHKVTGKKPFEVLAFPSGSFDQELGSDKDVSTFCTKEYKITFPLFTIGPVVDKPSKGEVAQPVYEWLYQQPGMSTPVAWNFEKFLVSKDGKAVKRWLSAVSPDEGGEIDKAIEAELAK